MTSLSPKQGTLFWEKVVLFLPEKEEKETPGVWVCSWKKVVLTLREGQVERQWGEGLGPMKWLLVNTAPPPPRTYTL